MARLFGREYGKREVLGYAGNLAQVGGIRQVELAAGRERGVRAYEVSTGSGLEFTVLADRALDIAGMSYKGVNFAYLTPGGAAHPAFYEPQGAGWLQSFTGGLVATCGLATAGAPSTDAGQALGLHGRVGTLPAEEGGAWTAWQGDECWLHIAGTVTEGVIFGNPLRLVRQITARLGGGTVQIHDTVENIGGEPTPHMMLYHCNLGWPLLSPEAQLITNSLDVVPRDAVAAPGLADWARFQEPTPGYAEQVFYHEMAADNDGHVRLALVNPALGEGGLGLGMRYHKSTLPKFGLWKQMGYGSYVVGLEPANCGVEGRATERDRGSLVVLQPGETRDYQLEFTVLDGTAAIEEFTQQIRG